MTDERTSPLLVRLNRGEVDAVAELHAAYSAYIRAVVRRQLSAQLRAQFDSTDVVQSVCVQIVRRISGTGLRLETESQLRMLLGVIAKRRLCTRARSSASLVSGRSNRDESPDGLPENRHSRPSEIAQADETWNAMLSLCPPEHREILHLRRQGHGLAEIATATGLHEGSVRRIIRKLSCDLAVLSSPGESSTRPPSFEVGAGI